MNKTGKGGFGERRKDINLSGRPPGHSPLQELKDAMRLKDKARGSTLLDRYLDLALVDKAVLMDLMKKVYPNAQSIQIDGQMTLKDFFSVLRGQENSDEKTDDPVPDPAEKNKPESNQPIDE